MKCCLACGAVKQLTEHHLVSKAKIRSLGIVVPNQLTIILCDQCHRLFHAHAGTDKEFKKERDAHRKLVASKLTKGQVEYIIRIAGLKYCNRLYPAGE